MIHITDKTACCGCGACAQRCPKQCITLEEDAEGFLYPVIDETLCIGCGLCEKVCNELNPYDGREPLQVLAAINKDEEVRVNSSSGGIFHILAERVITEGGVVFGARFDADWQVVIDYTEDMEGVRQFMGSKYVQARTGTAYTDAKRFLAQGRKVLFSGTPCQVAGLHKFLGKEYDNLLTVDLICHGTPSPKVWKMYLGEVVRQGQRICGIEFRNKKMGWKRFSVSIRYNDGDKTVSLLSPLDKNPYMAAFLKDIILRPSCHDCKAKGGSSRSDLTIADFWGISRIMPNMDDDKGTGLVFINTMKGKQHLDLSRMQTEEALYEQVKPMNPACYRSAKAHPRRSEFFERLGKENLIDLIEHCTKPSARQRLLTDLCHYKLLIKKLLGVNRGG